MRDKAIYLLQLAMQAPLHANLSTMARKLEELVYVVKPSVEVRAQHVEVTSSSPTHGGLQDEVDVAYKDAIMRLRALLAHDSKECVPGLALALADGTVSAEAVVGALEDRGAVVAHLLGVSRTQVRLLLSVTICWHLVRQGRDGVAIG